MDAGQPSGTALSAALLRAVHLVCDGDPPILRDELAAGLCGAEDRATLQTLLARMHTEAEHIVGAAHAATVIRAVRAAVLTRGRYTEEVVRAALPRGVTQYVILGAGLDTFAYRHRDLEAFELGLSARPRDLPMETPSLARVEWEHIQRVLADCDHNISQAARLLGIHRRSLQRKLLKYPVPENAPD